MGLLLTRRLLSGPVSGRADGRIPETGLDEEVGPGHRLGPHLDVDLGAFDRADQLGAQAFGVDGIVAGAEGGVGDQLVGSLPALFEGPPAPASSRARHWRRHRSPLRG